MTVNYKGINEDYNYRVAEICYTEEEEILLNKMCKPLELKGWDIENGVEGYATVKVDNMDEYKDFVKDYKEVKKSAKLWIKF